MSPDKLSHGYLLTTAGVAGKAELTQRFLHRKIDEYEKLKEDSD
jgi:hypothetical protein